MCLDPATLASMAISAAGAGINASQTNASNAAQINARNAATEAELARQQGYQAQANTIFNSGLGTFAPAAQTAGLRAAQTGAGDIIHGNQPTDVGSILTAGAAPQSAAAEGTNVANAFARNADRGTALGNLTGYATQGENDKLNLDDTSRNLGVVNNFSQGSAALLPDAQTAASNNAYRAPSGLGDILGFVGNLGAYNAGRGTLPTKSIFATGAPMNITPTGV